MTVTAATVPMSFTLDLEDHRGDGLGPRHYQDNARRILDFLSARGVRATIFVVGEIVDDSANLLRRACNDGHELALHSYAHTPLTAECAEYFAAELDGVRRRLEDHTGAAVTGFRAPVFSLTPASRWATAILRELGFAYSSSVLPGAHPLFGFPGAPAQPFRWPCGLIELPVPVVRLGPVTLPFLGGVYLRYLPLWLIERWRRRLARGILPWSYVHPYDVDTRETYFRFPGTSAPMSLLLWRRRGVTLRRLEHLLQASGGVAAPPLGELVASGHFDHVPTFTPAAAEPQ